MEGFYMGNNVEQPLTLICQFPKAQLYEVYFHKEGLSIASFKASLEWAMVIAYFRGYTNDKRFIQSTLSHDVITGPIADDRMYYVLDEFFNGRITDHTLMLCLSALDLGIQWVAKTQKACDNVVIIGSNYLSEDDRSRMIRISRKNRELGKARADAIIRANRRNPIGKFFDEYVGG